MPSLLPVQLSRPTRFSARWLGWTLTLLLLVLASAACGGSSPGGLPASPTPLSVDPDLRVFFASLGGAARMGEIISPVITSGLQKKQIAVYGSMIFDPQAPSNSRFRLEPVALSSINPEPAVPPPSDPAVLYRSGHIIPAEFASLYLAMGDEAVVGPPLTEMRYNATLDRFEQFFAGAGFFRRATDPEGTVRLMAYGAASCPTCRSAAIPIDAIIDLGAATNAPTLAPAATSYFMFIPNITRGFLDDVAFQAALAELSPNFTGPPLTAPFIAPDGALEVIYKNIAVFADPRAPRQLQLRDVSRQIGIVAAELEPPANRLDLGFYEIERGRGYNIPFQFLHYLDLHGGLAVAGPPLTGVQQVEPQVWRQCFTNLCLEEDRGAAEGIWIRLTPLGKSYQQLVRPNQETLAFNLSGRVITVQSWPQYESLPPDAQQVISAQITDNGLAAEGVQPTLSLTLADGARQTYAMPPTDSDGQTRYTLPPIPAPNGTVIGYQVCLFAPSGEQYCFRGKWVIFANP